MNGKEGAMCRCAVIPTEAEVHILIGFETKVKEHIFSTKLQTN